MVHHGCRLLATSITGDDVATIAVTPYTLVIWRVIQYSERSNLMDMFEGKRGLILGVANDRSSAWAIAPTCGQVYGSI